MRNGSHIFNTKIVIAILLMCLVGSTFADDAKRAIKRKESQVVTGVYRALIIGNNEYRDRDKIWQPLRTARSGATEFAKLLRSEYGFVDVILLTDATARDVMNAFSQLQQRVEPADSVLIYYAGHGHLEQDTNIGYWIPVDARGNDRNTYIRNSTIRDEVNVIADRSKHTLLLVDSCFSGELFRGEVRGATLTRGKNSYYERLASKKSVEIFTAGGKEFVDDNYRNSGHSPFTYFLLNELKTNNELMSFSELTTAVTKAVAMSASQTPQGGAILNAGHELGEFIFTRYAAGDSVAMPSSNGDSGFGDASNGITDSTPEDVILPALRF